MPRTSRVIPLLGVCAYGSGSGKTTLLTKLIPELKTRGLRVSLIKHAHHNFDIDHPGKDSYRLREAGAVQTLLASSKRWALLTELPDPREADIEELTAQLDPQLADLVLVEGLRQAGIPKIEVHRPGLGYPLLADADPNVIAIATDEPVSTTLPLLDLNNAEEVAGFVLQWHQTQTIQTAQC